MVPVVVGVLDPHARARREALYLYRGKPCPWCGETLRGGDAHEYLVKRGAVVRGAQHLIFVIENTIIAHHQCHIRYGQTKEFKIRCLRHAIKHLGAKRIAEWYISLWRAHGIPVPCGTVDLLPDHEAYLASVLGVETLLEE